MDEEEDLIRVEFTAETNTAVLHDQHETTHACTHTLNALKDAHTLTHSTSVHRGDLQGASTSLLLHSEKFCAD